jgi:hypothetical protein
MVDVVATLQTKPCSLQHSNSNGLNEERRHYSKILSFSPSPLALMMPFGKELFFPHRYLADNYHPFASASKQPQQLV